MFDVSFSATFEINLGTISDKVLFYCFLLFICYIGGSFPFLCGIILDVKFVVGFTIISNWGLSLAPTSSPLPNVVFVNAKFGTDLYEFVFHLRLGIKSYIYSSLWVIIRFVCWCWIRHHIWYEIASNFISHIKVDIICIPKWSNFKPWP